MASISRAVRQAVKNRLADDVSGFTPRLEMYLATESFLIPPNFVLPIQFDGSSYNFFEADLDTKYFDETTAITYPVLTLFSARSRNANLEKFSLFAGLVSVQINVFASWTNESADADFAVFGDCAETALYATFNDQSLRDWANQASIPGQVNVVWNGEMSFNRSRIVAAAENWQQTYSAVLDFEAHVLVA